MDHVLEAYLASPDEEQSEQELGDLLARHAAPLVGRIVSRRLGGPNSDVEDVSAHVLLQLMVRLRRGRLDPSVAAIDAFASYVATAAHHGCDHLIRAKYPERWRLRGRLRYALEHDRHFALWRSGDGALIGGLAEWRARQPSDTAPSGNQLADIANHHVRALLTRVFQLAGAPLELNSIVSAATDAWGIRQIAHDNRESIEEVADPAPGADAALEERGRLADVWAQIRDLPIRQRHALLLNLKDDAITVFLTTGTASVRDIASALELPVETFAALWNELPIPDNAVAERLGCTRQQVINLRMAARKRLANRFGAQANIGGVRVL